MIATVVMVVFDPVDSEKKAVSRIVRGYESVEKSWECCVSVVGHSTVAGLTLPELLTTPYIDIRIIEWRGGFW